MPWKPRSRHSKIGGHTVGATRAGELLDPASRAAATGRRAVHALMRRPVAGVLATDAPRQSSRCTPSFGGG